MLHFNIPATRDLFCRDIRDHPLRPIVTNPHFQQIAAQELPTVVL